MFSQTSHFHFLRAIFFLVPTYSNTISTFTSQYHLPKIVYSLNSSALLSYNLFLEQIDNNIPAFSPELTLIYVTPSSAKCTLRHVQKFPHSDSSSQKNLEGRTTTSHQLNLNQIPTTN